jgi:hypothetical protein
LKFIVLSLIRIYQLIISPLFPSSCRFTPTCSNYAAKAIADYGLIKGCKLAIKRIIKCNPWGAHGHDPVPDKDE